ncbi:MAG TPA: class I SAM-dependent methyltransferase [Micromonosporaceae bacterium]
MLAPNRTPSAHAVSQYANTTGNLSARIAIHQFSTNPQDWFSWLDERIPRAGDVLEVGAGTGALWQRLDPTGLRLTLTDFSAAMCAHLRAGTSARVVRCDATALPFPDGHFDSVIANHMLYHLDDPESGVREFARVLRPGGRVTIATNGRRHLAELNDLAVAIGRADLVLATNQNDFTAEAGPALVARHFADVRVEAYPGDLAVPAAEPVIAVLNSLGEQPLNQSQEAAARDRIGAAIAADGCYRIAKHTVLITATR